MKDKVTFLYPFLGELITEGVESGKSVYVTDCYSRIDTILSLPGFKRTSRTLSNTFHGTPLGWRQKHSPSINVHKHLTLPCPTYEVDVDRWSPSNLQPWNTLRHIFLEVLPPKLKRMRKFRAH